MRESDVPLIAITRRRRPFAAGFTIVTRDAAEPADWPPIVTFDGSPPKLAMLSCTHSSAATQSRTARFDGAPSISRNPSTPRR
jgi:hypothetical protein